MAHSDAMYSWQQVRVVIAQPNLQTSVHMYDGGCGRAELEQSPAVAQPESAAQRKQVCYSCGY